MQNEQHCNYTLYIHNFTLRENELRIRRNIRNYKDDGNRTL